MEVEIEGGEEKGNELEIINENKKITSQKTKKKIIYNVIQVSYNFFWIFTNEMKKGYIWWKHVKWNQNIYFKKYFFLNPLINVINITYEITTKRSSIETYQVTINQIGAKKNDHIFTTKRSILPNVKMQ